MMVKWNTAGATKIEHQMALLSTMLKLAKTISKWCPTYNIMAILLLTVNI